MSVAFTGSQALLLDATDYFANPDLSDVIIVIREDITEVAEPHSTDGTAEQQSTVFRKAPLREARIPGHKIILSAYSELFKTQLARWSEQDELELTVPSGQLAVGELLIRCIYEPQPDLAGCSQQLLIDLLQLADRHDVKKAVYAASTELSNIPTDQLEWSTAMTVFSLPPGCAELEAYKPVFAAATARVVAELGDLEVAWQQIQKQQLLLALPFAALLVLLQDDATKVASENTIAYTTQQWAEHQQLQHKQRQQQHMTEPPEQGAYPSREQLQQLAEQIRMGQCTQLYIATVMPYMPAIAPCFTAGEWLCACALAQHSAGNVRCECFVPVTRVASGTCGVCGMSVSQTFEATLLTQATSRRHPAVRRHPAWALGTRPKSVLNHLLINWSVSVEEVAAAIDASVGPESRMRMMSSPGAVWAGRCVTVHLLADPHGIPMHIDVDSAHAPQLDEEVCSFEVRVTAATMPASGGPANPSAELCMHHDRRIIMQPLIPAMLKDVFEIGSVQSGFEVERKLRERQLVQQDGCIHLTIQLRNPVM